ncbi:MAG TPA: thiolase domain-containing protein [Patescibacteria group bacterium]|nr:thiolase domain-containing protein [Patescibacteria group bacterium]
MYITGAYQTQFGELWDKDLKDLIVESGEAAIKDSGIKRQDIDLVLVANMLAGNLEGQNHLGALAAELLGLSGVNAGRVEAACASGGVAVNQAITALKAKTAKNVLVIGAEKMTDKSNAEVSTGLMGAASGEERRAGLTFVGLYGLMARVYFDRFKMTKNDLAYVAVKNHKHASLNPKAQYPFAVDMETVLKSSCVASPLHLFDCSPITDGAAAVILTDKARSRRDIDIAASQVASDSLSLTERDSLVELKATKLAVQKAYREAGITSKSIDLAEVHDCFSIAEIMAVEDLGFCKKGDGFKKIRAGEFDHDGRLPVNLSGGLKACGHPVGATGVKQVVEIVTQLRGEAGKRQTKKAKIGLTHNVGGSGATAAVHILKKR